MREILNQTGELTFAIIIISIVFALLAFMIVVTIYLHKKRVRVMLIENELQQAKFEKQMLQTQIEVQEATLSTLAKELHDNIGQLLTSTKLMLGIGRMKLKEVPDSLVMAEETMGKAIAELRSLSKSLNQEWLQQFSLADNLQAEVTRINANESVHIQLSLPDDLFLKSEKQIILFRIIQEAMQNALKHANPQQIGIKIWIENSFLFATIADDGTGIPEGNKEGLGFTNMKQRIASLLGNISWKTANPQGCLVSIKIPVNTEL